MTFLRAFPGRTRLSGLILTNQNSDYTVPLRCIWGGRLAIVGLVALGIAVPVSAQTVELPGSRALGMGGAFVAVASDSTATWWNPAGLAAGPLFDTTLGRATVDAGERLPVWRQTVTWFALATPPLGVSYYRFRVTDVQPFNPTAPAGPDREDRRAGVPVNSLSASQLGVTLVQTLVTGVHAGATLKYVRGTLHTGREDSLFTPDDLLDRGEALDNGDTKGRFDLDVGLLAVTGPLRFGALVRNVLEPEFGSVRMPRQTRIGVAFDPEPVTGLPLTVAFDWDVQTYDTASGRRRSIALGAEQWIWNKRLGIRAGGRANTTGAEERALTAGASVAVRPGLFVEGHVTHAGDADERGWGVGARASF